MSRFSIAFQTVAPTGAQALAELIGGASRDYKLVELALSIDSQASVDIGLGFSSSLGLVPSPDTVLPSESTGDSSTGQVAYATSWGTDPGVPATFYRRDSIGILTDRLKWKWESGDGLWILHGTSLVLWAFAAGPILNVSAVVED